MKSFVFCALLVFLGLAVSQELNCPTEDDALTANNAELDIYSTDDFNENEVDLGDSTLRVLAVSQDAIRNQQDAETSDDLKVTIEAESQANLALDDAIAIPYYYTTCPYKWVKVDRYKYYYKSVMYPKGQVVYMYHWNYYPYWYTACATHYCRIRYDVLNWWDYRYRCFPEYRYVYVWMLKLTVTYNTNSDGTLTYVSHTWTRFLTRLRLPRGCCCRRYWRFKTLTAAQCPAGIP